MTFDHALDEATQLLSYYPKISAKKIRPIKNKKRKAHSVKKTKNKLSLKAKPLPRHYTRAGNKIKKGSNKGTAARIKW